MSISKEKFISAEMKEKSRRRENKYKSITRKLHTIESKRIIYYLCSGAMCEGKNEVSVFSPQCV